MKIRDLQDKLKHYPPDSEVRIQGACIDDLCVFYDNGCYVIGDFNNPPQNESSPFSEPLKGDVEVCWVDPPKLEWDY